MRIEINVYLKDDKLDLLPTIIKEFEIQGYVLSDTLILPRRAEYMYTFTERRDFK